LIEPKFQIIDLDQIRTTLTQNENVYTAYNGIYYTWGKTPVTPNAGNEIQPCVGMLNFISWGVSL